MSEVSAAHAATLIAHPDGYILPPGVGLSFLQCGVPAGDRGDALGSGQPALKVLLADLPACDTSSLASIVWIQGVVVSMGDGFVDVDDGTAVVSLDPGHIAHHAWEAFQVGCYVSCICRVVGDMDLRVERACRLDGAMAEQHWWLELAHRRL